MKVYKSSKMKQKIRKSYDILLEKWKVAYTEQDVVTSYGMTHIITCGENNSKPLVLFHGVGDDSALMWIYNARYLSKYYHIYAIDTLGGPGKSEPGPMYNKDFDDIDWIDQILDQLEIKCAYFAGVSHGGYLVQAYALCRPERVMKGISISGAVPVGHNKTPMATMMKIFLPEALIPTRKNVEKLIRKLSGENAAVFLDDKDIMEHYTCLLRGFRNMAMGYHKVRYFTEQEIDAIRDKIQYLVGTDDPFQQLGGAVELREHHMNVTFYEATGHGLNHERADEINQKIVAILR